MPVETDMNNSNQESLVPVGQQLPRRSRIGRIIRSLRDQRGHLTTMAEAKRGQTCTGQVDRGFRYVPISSIKGTVQRPHDFDRNFRPTQNHTRARWESVNRAFEQGIELPPVRLLKYRDAYYVIDGHHRVSVARHRGGEWVDAIVTEYCPAPESQAE